MNKEIEEMAFTEEERELYRDIWEGLGIQDYWDECIWKKARVENCSLALIRKGYRKQEWIPVDEKLPEPGDYDYYLIQARFTINGDYTIPRVAKFRDGKWFVLDYDDKSFEDFLMTVTHWMPLSGLQKGAEVSRGCQELSRRRENDE